VKKFLLSFFFVFLLVSPSSWALEPGTTGADILKSPVGVRPAAMAGAYSAYGDDVYVIGFNPAGLARISKYSVGLDHVQGFADVQTESLSVVLPTRNYGNIGGQIVFRHLPTISNDLASDPTIDANDVLLTIADGQQFGAVAVGVALKTIFSTLGEKQAFSQALDLGVKVQAFQTDFAFVVQNAGPAVQFEPNAADKDPLPLTFRLGAARPIFVSPSATLLASVEALNVSDEGNSFSVGVEYWHRSVLALRAGYRFGDQPNLSGGFSAGAGIRFSVGKLESEIGYAWRPAPISSGFVANSHLFGLLFWY